MIDSANRLLPSVLGSARTLLGTAPAGAVRYLAEYAVTRQEVEFAHSQGLALGLCWNGATGADVAGTRALGTTHGRRAVVAARGLGAPDGTALILDVEASWNPTADFLAGYADAVHTEGFTAGFYGAASSSPFVTAFSAAAAADPAASGAVLWDAAWETAGTLPHPLPTSLAGRTIAGRQCALWQFAGGVASDTLDLTLADAALPGFWRPPTAGQFTDVAPGAPYAAAVEAVARLGLMRGAQRDPARFEPSRALTRAEAAEIVARIARRAGWD